MTFHELFLVLNLVLRYFHGFAPSQVLCLSLLTDIQEEHLGSQGLQFYDRLYYNPPKCNCESVKSTLKIIKQYTITRKLSRYSLGE